MRRERGKGFVKDLDTGSNKVVWGRPFRKEHIAKRVLVHMVKLLNARGRAQDSVSRKCVGPRGSNQESIEQGNARLMEAVANGLTTLALARGVGGAATSTGQAVRIAHRKAHH